jgi:ClpP class serine protease
MAKSGRSKAEEFFAVTQKKEKKAQREKEKERQEMAEHVAKLRGLRLAKEAADKEAAEIAAAEKAATKKKKPARLPQAHRQRP